MLRTLTYCILSAADGQTILHYLKSLGYSGPILVHLKKTDHGVLLNGVWVHMNETLHTGDLLCLHLEENTSGTSIFPQQIPLAICYEDEDLLVIDKPAGMPVHPSAAHQRDTLANAVTGYYRAKGEIRPFRCINRLDADTSGLIIVAKNMLSAALLGKAMQQRMIRREYLAVVCGTLTGSGTVHAPIARVKPGDVRRQIDFLCGDDAITHYESLLCHAPYSLLSLHLETGRTHQIRVHMKYIGHTLFNDERYGGHDILKGTTFTKYKQFVQNCFAICPRQALHAKTLGFVHPTTGEEMFFDSEIPSDMQQLIDRWRVYANTKEL